MDPGRLGVPAGSALLVHTSYPRIGPVEGGPGGLIRALEAAIVTSCSIFWFGTSARPLRIKTGTSTSCGSSGGMPSAIAASDVTPGEALPTIPSGHSRPRLIQSTFGGFAPLSRGGSGALAAVIGQRLRDRGKHLPSLTHTMPGDPGESARDSRFDGSGRRSHKAVRRGITVQPDASIVSSIALTPQEAFSDESLEDARDRTRVQMDDARELSSREPGAHGHDPKNEPLRTSNAESRLHAF
jgi:hypothetical protein